MSLWDSIKSLGTKAVGAVQALGSKGLGEINTLGTKASEFAHKALASPIAQDFLLANPEIAGAAGGALSALDTALGVSKFGEKALKGYEEGEQKKKVNMITKGDGLPVRGRGSRNAYNSLMVGDKAGMGNIAPAPAIDSMADLRTPGPAISGRERGVYERAHPRKKR